MLTHGSIMLTDPSSGVPQNKRMSNPFRADGWALWGIGQVEKVGLEVTTSLKYLPSLTMCIRLNIILVPRVRMKY